MEQINTYGFFLLGKWMDSTFLHARVPLNQNIHAWQSCRAVLAILLQGDAKIKLNESAPAGRALLAQYDTALADYAADPEFRLSDERVLSFNAAWGLFEQAVQLDLGRAPIYFVTQKGIYSTHDLINGAELALVEDVYNGISREAVRDINQAGRCLAFGIWTACGFHVLRATEKVLREYYEALVKKPIGRNTMGQLIQAMREDAQADAKTLAVLDQLRDLHRNPMNHPEVFLEQAEAMELFNICISAISASVRQIAKVKGVDPVRIDRPVGAP